MTPPFDPPDWRRGERFLWSAMPILATAVLLRFREDVGGAHVAMAYLLIVLGASARSGRRVGMVLALVCFFSFNFFFIPPYHTLLIHRRMDWLVLFAFLATSAVATQLLHRAQAEAEAARRRAHEIDRLAALGAETLNAGRAEDAVVAIAEVIQSGLEVDVCEIYLLNGEADSVRRVARAVRSGDHDPPPDPADSRLLRHTAAGLAVAERADGTFSVARATTGQSAMEILLAAEARALVIPLRVRERPVGALRLASLASVSLSAAQQRFAEALAYYAALGLERVRLSAAAEHAEALREADRLKDAVLAAISHDLRTPLTTIKALAHEIAGAGDPRAIIVEEEADRLNRFVSDLLDLSQLNSGTLSATPELVDAEDLLGAALQQVSGVMNGRTIRAALDSPDTLLIGRFDFVHTLRALVNVIDNARKYSPEDAAVEVCVRRQDRAIVFEVADRGPGIPKEDHERAFAPFYRGGGVPDVGGTGLGLAIARRFIELQGGSLTYRPRDGGGSMFTLRVPAAEISELERMSS
jgi:two-component system sensor histidine kinase KdpD